MADKRSNLRPTKRQGKHIITDSPLLPNTFVVWTYKGIMSTWAVISIKRNQQSRSGVWGHAGWRARHLSQEGPASTDTHSSNGEKRVSLVLNTGRIGQHEVKPLKCWFLGSSLQGSQSLRGNTMVRWYRGYNKLRRIHILCVSLNFWILLIYFVTLGHYTYTLMFLLLSCKKLWYWCFCSVKNYA